MGGKTHQRVAGNVKPSSSGRIRELLINKHGVGNVITFSTLATTSQSTEAGNQTKPDTSKNHDIPPTETDNIISPTKQNTTVSPTSPIVASNEKYKLVVRRVGNRDLFTRVKIDAERNENVELHSATSSQPIDDCVDTTNTSKDTSSSSRDLLEDKGVQIDPVRDASADRGDEQVDFDTILDQLDRAKALRLRTDNMNLLDFPNEYFERESELIRIFKQLVQVFKEDMSIQEWDLIVQSMNQWLGAIIKCDKLSTSKVIADHCIEVFDFIYSLVYIAEQLRQSAISEDEFPMREALLTDWDNFQSSETYMNLIGLFFKIAPQENMSETDIAILESLAQIVVEVNPRMILDNPTLTNGLSTDPIFDKDFQLPKSSRYCLVDDRADEVFLAICSLLRSNFRVVLISAHAILRQLIKSLSKSVDLTLLTTENDDIDKLTILPPTCLMSVLTLRDPLMALLLSDYKVGDVSVTIDPSSDSYSCALSYLYVWDLLTEFIVNLDKEFGHRIVHSLKKLGLTQRLLDNIFIMLPPPGEKNSLKFRIESETRANKLIHIEESTWSLVDFLKSPLKTTVPRPVNEIELDALHVYFSVALHFPVTVRKWFNNNSNKRLCNLVNEYTSQHISQVICSLEMKAVQEECQRRTASPEPNNLVIKARPNAREVYASYTRDEFKLELTIKLPMNYPLGSVQIDGGKRVGVTDLKWRSWLLQLTTFLSHQNGPILDGIDLWRRNIDKRFEGIEQCTICFSILHSNYQLPKKRCVTCTKMFHSSCLYKWFETSCNTTCPMCRRVW